MALWWTNRLDLGCVPLDKAVWLHNPTKCLELDPPHLSTSSVIGILVLFDLGVSRDRPGMPVKQVVRQCDNQSIASRIGRPLPPLIWSQAGAKDQQTRALPFRMGLVWPLCTLCRDILSHSVTICLVMPSFSSSYFG